MTTYYVDVYRTLAKVVEIEADSPEEAEQKAIDNLDSTVWHLQDLTDDAETSVSGQLNAKGEREYYY
jgi:hypothetical protein